MNCLNCNKILEGKWAKRFCNRSCAGQYNGRAHPKRSRERANWPKCRTCDNIVVAKYYKYCRDCIEKKKHYHGAGPLELQTIEQAIKRTGANTYDKVRAHARYVLYKEELKGSCEKCGYDKHVELCHIKPISSFSRDTLLSEVNRRDNVMFLCPNCHWEHDHQ